ncbi:MAG TPA: hypothetical protein VLS25_00610 [Dehalococcoidia bacterium]|nr:hypothetical protein [Dehalococcoidia bacterium]
MTAAAPRPGLIVAFKIFCHVTTLLVLLQAVLAGLFISDEASDAMDQHEMTAYVLLLAVVVQLVLAYLTRGWGQFRLLYWVAVLAVAVVVQLGLGFASEDHKLPEAIHIPLGVFIFGLSAVVSTLAVLESRSQAPAA